MVAATWSNGKRTQAGWWTYNWAADRFTITLATKQGREGVTFHVHGDTPEWGRWRLVRMTYITVATSRQG